MVGVAAAAVVLVAAGIVALGLSSRVRPSSESRPAKKTLIALDRNSAAAARWIVAQVSRAALVACDPAMCTELTNDGFSGSVYRVQPKSNYPQSAAVVVETPALRFQFGTSLGTNVAPMVLAEFGRGAALVAVRVIASHGARAYEAALRANLKERQAVGSTLASSRQVADNRVVRQALNAGDVDLRLLIVMEALAYSHPIDILAFGARSPGASRDVPLRVAEFAEIDKAAKMSTSAYVKFMTGVLQGQPPAYRPEFKTVGHVLLVMFPAPTPID